MAKKQQNSVSFCHHHVCFADTLSKAAPLQLACSCVRLNISQNLISFGVVQIAKSGFSESGHYVYMHKPKNKDNFKTRILSQCKESKIAIF